MARFLKSRRRFPMTAIPMRALALFGLLLAVSCMCAFDGCKHGLAGITYHQVGACTTFPDTGSGIYQIGPNLAWVVFRVDAIDNTSGSVNFNFDPSKLFVNAGGKDFVSPNNWNSSLNGIATQQGPVTVNKGAKASLGGFVIVEVPTANPNGAAGANQTTYYLGYNTGPSDPGVLPGIDRTWTPLSTPQTNCTLLTYN
jgi:hypothetical protein